MIDSGLLILATSCGYIGSLVLLARWFAACEATHVLPLDGSQPGSDAGTRWWAALRAVPALGLAAAMLVLEMKAFVLVGAWALDISCPYDWLPVPDCSLELDSAHPGRGTALAIFICCAAAFFAAHQFISRSIFYPATALILAMLAFGAASDLVAGSHGIARSGIVFRLTAGLQLTAAAALLLGLVVIRSASVPALIHCLLAHMAGACVRILAALLMLALWPSLPAASAVALVAVAMLLPGVASALSAAAALASARE